MNWLYIIIGVILSVILICFWGSKIEKEEARKLGITVSEYRKKMQYEREENKRYKTQYGMSKAKYLELEKISQECREHGLKLDVNFQKEFLEKYSDLGRPTIEICFHKQLWKDKGVITRAQYFEYGWTCNSITIWQDKKTFLLLGENNKIRGNPFPESIQKPLPFNTLVSCEATDDTIIIHGNALSTTKTSKLGMITRGAVGGALFGNVGALAGAMTANTKTETAFEADTIQHNYKIHLTLNDFSCPLLTLEFGKSETQMRQVLSVLNLIIKNS